jgi:hypothetical protein
MRLMGRERQTATDPAAAPTASSGSDSEQQIAVLLGLAPGRPT